MAHTAALVDVLKRELKARGVTYADLARQLRLSEASVKRMFSRRRFHAEAPRRDLPPCADRILRARARVVREETLISHLTLEQEKEIVSDRKLFLVAVCALNHVTFDQIVETYDITERNAWAAGAAGPAEVHRAPARQPHQAAGLPHLLVAARRADPALFQQPGPQRILPLALQPRRTSSCWW